MTMYQKELGRTVARACMWSARTIATINLYIPCNVISDVWYVGASAKNALYCKIMRIIARIRLFLHVGLSRCEDGTAAYE